MRSVSLVMNLNFTQAITVRYKQFSTGLILNTMLCKLNRASYFDLKYNRVILNLSKCFRLVSGCYKLHANMFIGASKQRGGDRELGVLGMLASLSRFNFFHFHAVFGKNLAK